MGFLKTKISWGLTHLLRKCDSGKKWSGLFSPSGHGFAGGSCRQFTPSLGDIGIHLLLTCPSSFSCVLLYVFIPLKQTSNTHISSFLIAKRSCVLTSSCWRRLKALNVLLLLIFLWSSKELHDSKVINKKQNGAEYEATLLNEFINE